VIQALLGHTKRTTTARYASVTTGMTAAVDSPLDDLAPAKRKKKARPPFPTLPRPTVEVADIFRDQRHVYRAANTGFLETAVAK